jgi:membrane protein
MLKLFIHSLKNWFDDDPFTQSAAAAYYAIFSFPGLLIITMSVAAFAFDQQQVETQVVGKLSQMLGAETAQNLNEIAQETQRKDRDVWALVIGLLTLSFGATGLFAHLQRALNQIFEVEVKESAGIWLFIKARLISFGVVLMLGFLLLISLSLTAVINLLSDWISAQFSPAFSLAIAVVNVLVSFLLTILLFTLIYRILPDARMAWRSAAMGGVVAALFFKIGEQALNIYFELAEPGSSFGAAGSLVLLMLWVSYSCMILLLGAEFAKAYQQVEQDKAIKPSEIAEKTD